MLKKDIKPCMKDDCFNEVHPTLYVEWLDTGLFKYRTHFNSKSKLFLFKKVVHQGLSVHWGLSLHYLIFIMSPQRYQGLLTEISTTAHRDIKDYQQRYQG